MAACPIVSDSSQRLQLHNYAVQLSTSVQEIVKEAIQDWLDNVGPARLGVLARKTKGQRKRLPETEDKCPFLDH